MLSHPTHEHLTQLRLFGMARALAEQSSLPELQSLSFEERLGQLVDRERAERQNWQTSSRLRRARLKQPAVAEDIDYRRMLGRIKCGGIDASEEQVRRGVALVFARAARRRIQAPRHDRSARTRFPRPTQGVRQFRPRPSSK